MLKMILIAIGAFLAIAVIELIWFVVSAGVINQSHKWEENPDETEREAENENSKYFKP